MGKDKSNQNPQQMGNKGGFQQKQPGKENLNPQRPQTGNLNTQKPMGGGHIGGQGQPQQKQPFTKKDSWTDKK